MKHFFLLSGFLLSLQALNAQTISRSVIAAQGGHYADSALQVSYTVGEPITQTLSAVNLMLTQGFQQPDSMVSISLNITCFIQGYYLWNGEMQPVLYNQGISTDLSVTDTLGVQIIEANPPYNVVQNLQAILHTNGTLSCKLNPSLFGHAYYIALQHRNAVETWSANPVTINGNTAYNFSTAAAQAFGDNQKDISGNGTLFALYSGDNVKDGNIDLYDLNAIESDIIDFAYGYYTTDINGDGNVDLYDLLWPEENVTGFVYAVHP
jgi:hypothetical protein